MCRKNEERDMALFCLGSQWEGSPERLLVEGRRGKQMERHAQVSATEALGSSVESHQREPRFPRSSKQQTPSLLNLVARGCCLNEGPGVAPY